MANPVEKFLKKFLRNYDIDRIREQRVFHSFSIGRKIIPQENTDETINTQIENTINQINLIYWFLMLNKNRNAAAEL